MEEETLEFTLKIPATIKARNVKSFFPVMSPSKAYMLLAVSFVGSEHNLWEKYKYKSVIIIDMRLQKAFTDSELNRL